MKIAFVHNLQRSLAEEEAEFDTPAVIEAIQKAITSGGHEVIPIEMTKDGKWIDLLKQSACDLGFNTAEGFAGVGRESYAPVVFEQLNIPCVGSGSYPCFLTLDKFLTKQVVARQGVKVPSGYFITNLEDLDVLKHELHFPLFVKPNFEGSSKGITKDSVCRDFKALKTQCQKLLTTYPDGIIAEAYIEGRDITVPYVSGLGDDGVLEAVEYTLEGFNSQDEASKEGWIYDYDLKNKEDAKVGVRCPALLSPHEKKTVAKAMRKAVQALGVLDMARADFRITPQGEVYFIELNALPSLQPGAGLFEASKQLGLSYDQTLLKIVEAAQKRLRLHKKKWPMRSIRKHLPNVALVYNLKRKSHDDADYEHEAEFDSEATIKAIESAIKAAGFPVTPIEATKNLGSDLQANNIDVVFNIAEGSQARSREAQVPALCDLLGIEHTGSDATCLAVTLDKALSCKVLDAEGLRTPHSMIIEGKIPKQIKLQYPLIVKPNLEGTSKGIYSDSVVHDYAGFEKIIQRLQEKGFKQILAQEYIEGREMTVGILGQDRIQVLKPLEIVFKKQAGEFPVYSFEHKQLDEQLDNEFVHMQCPAEIDDKEWKRIKKFASSCFKVLGCRDVSRLDFRLNKSGEPVFIEINPLPGLSPGFSDLTIMAEKQGIDYNELIKRIISPAVRRWRRHTHA